MSNKRKTPWQLINEMEQNGDLSVLVMAGFCSPKVFTHIEIARRVDAKVHTGTPKSRAVSESAVDFGMCNSAVFKILKIFKDYGNTSK